MPRGIYLRTKEHNQNIAKALMGHSVSLEARKKISLHNPKFYLGKKRPDMIERFKGKNNPFYGKHHTLKIRKFLSLKYKGTHLSESTKQKMRIIAKERGFGLWFKNRKGAEVNNWRGGITPLTKRIRHLLEYNEWIKSIFERDNYICQECFKQGGYLHSHHIKPFSKILQEFLKEYDQFSPIEDKETLVRLAIKWQPFWDINNGQTLCKECHKKTDTYKTGGKKCLKNFYLL